MNFSMRHRRAFTLIELLVVIAIIGVLIGLLLPAVQKVREAASRTQCKNNLKQIALACHGYHDTYGFLPPSFTPTYQGWQLPGGWAWSTLILPFIEQGNLYNQLSPATVDLKTVMTNNPALVQTQIKTYLCPSDSGGPNPNTNRPFALAGATINLGTSNYVGNNADQAGVFFDVGAPGSAPKGFQNVGQTISISQIGDGTSNTIMVGERCSTTVNYGSQSTCTTISVVPRSAGVWAGFLGYGTVNLDNSAPTNKFAFETSLLYMLNSGESSTACDAADGPKDAPSSMHPGGVQFAFCDGSVQFIQNNINWTESGTTPIGTLNRLEQIADGLPIGNY
jgi:prepilin-type N-terminal cleavage/methylation domain-containing protein/prepilin-type processing-associated H-X9-DG protein